VLSDIATPLIWRTGEAAAPVVALRDLARKVSPPSTSPSRPLAQRKNTAKDRSAKARSGSVP
jgi:hypothetical protein